MAFVKPRPKRMCARPRSGCWWLPCSRASRACTGGEPRWRGACAPCSLRCAVGPRTRRGMGQLTWWRCCGCCAGTCVGLTCRTWPCGAPICKGSRCRIPRLPERGFASASSPRPSMPSPRWPSARAASFGPRAAGRGEYGRGERTATPYTWPCRRTRRRSGLSPLVRTNGGFPAGAWLEASSRRAPGEGGRLRQQLSGHTEQVQCVAWSPDGRTVASGSFDHTIRLWHGKAGRSLTVLQGHAAAVNGLAFTPDSRHLLSGSEDGTLLLWEVERGLCVRVIQGYAPTLYDLDWSPDGKELASVGSDTEVCLWEVEGHKPPRVLRGHTWTVYGVAWRPHGHVIPTSGGDRCIRL